MLQATQRVARQLLSALLLIHVTACVFHWISHWVTLGGHESWISDMNLKSSSWADRYYASLYWTVATLTTTGVSRGSSVVLCTIWEFASKSRLQRIHAWKAESQTQSQGFVKECCYCCRVWRQCSGAQNILLCHHVLKDAGNNFEGGRFKYRMCI